MPITNFAGPVVVSGQRATSGTYNSDLAPSSFWGGIAMYDWRFAYAQDGPSTGGPRAYGFYRGGGMICIDQVPSIAKTNNIALAANPVSGTAMTLAATTGSGITVTTAPFTIPQTGNVVPTGALVIDSLPGVVAYGQTSAVNVMDPTLALSRAVQITNASGASGGAVTVAGFDLWGAPQTETITLSSGAATATGNKAWKFIQSVTPAYSNANTISVGVADKIGFPLRVDRFAYSTIFVQDTAITANTGFSAADQTSPATSVTSDARGTYALQSASNGTTLRVQMFVEMVPANCATITGVFGVTPA